MSNGKGNKNNRGGPPPWAGPPDHVEDKGNSVHVGKTSKEQLIEQAVNANDQMDRIEAKLDLLLDELGVE